MFISAVLYEFPDNVTFVGEKQHDQILLRDFKIFRKLKFNRLLVSISSCINFECQMTAQISKIPKKQTKIVSQN